MDTSTPLTPQPEAPPFREGQRVRVVGYHPVASAGLAVLPVGTECVAHNGSVIRELNDDRFWTADGGAHIFAPIPDATPDTPPTLPQASITEGVEHSETEGRLAQPTPAERVLAEVKNIAANERHAWEGEVVQVMCQLLERCGITVSTRTVVTFSDEPAP